MALLKELEATNPIRSVLECVPSMLAYWDRHLNCRFANDAYENWFGVDTATIMNTPLPELLGPVLYDLNRPLIEAALNGEAQEFERAAPRPGATRRTSLVNYIPHVVDGVTQGFTVQVTELTKLHDAREALQQKINELERANRFLQRSQAALEVAQRLGQIGSWEYEIDSDIVQWSTALYQIFGLDPTKLPPSFEQHASLYTEDSFVRLRQAVGKAKDLGAPYFLELEYINAHGRHGWLEARGTVERDETGNVVRLHGTAQDVTDRRAARAHRHEASAHSGQTFSERRPQPSASDEVCVEPEAGSRLLHELLYTSQLEPSAGIQCVVRIANDARHANKKSKITGLLVFDGERFCQHFEGPTNAVGRLYERISVDPRHTDVHILHEGPIEQRKYTSFTMGLANTDDHDLIAKISGLTGPEARNAFIAMTDQLDFGF